MAITPREAAKINDVAELKAIEDMEGYIDGILHKQFRTGMNVVVDGGHLNTAGGQGFSTRALEEVLKRFRSAGWAIRKKSTKERFGGSTHNYIFSEQERISVSYDPREQGKGCAPWYECDNEGKDPSHMR